MTGLICFIATKKEVEKYWSISLANVRNIGVAAKLRGSFFPKLISVDDAANDENETCTLERNFPKPFSVYVGWKHGLAKASSDLVGEPTLHFDSGPHIVYGGNYVRVNPNVRCDRRPVILKVHDVGISAQFGPP